MLFDTEGRQLTLLSEPNGHLKLNGGSGMGKTFCALQMMVEKLQLGMRILILDVSHSYTPDEFRKAHFPETRSVLYRNPAEDLLVLSLPEAPGNAAKRAAALFRKAFKIRGEQQSKLLNRCCKTLLERDDTLWFPDLLEMLEGISEDESDTNQKHAATLFNRLSDYQDFDGICLTRTADSAHDEEPPLTVLQLSDFEHTMRCELSMLVLEYLWGSIRDSKSLGTPPPWDIILVDEFQNLASSLHPGCALYSILRESRKYGISIWIATQYEDTFDSDTLEAMNQCANKLYFKPTPRRMRFTARLLSDSPEQWMPLLRDLRRGEAILDGTAHYVGSSLPVNGVFKVFVKQS